MTKTDKMLSVAKEFIRAAAKAAEYEGAGCMTRIDFCSANFGWRSRYNINHTVKTFGHHISPLMEEVANEEGWKFAYDNGGKNRRYNVRIEFPVNRKEIA